MKTTIPDLQQLFARLYNRRNFFVNGSFPERVIHLNRRFGRIADSNRKQEGMADRLAKAVSYFMSLVNYFGGELDLVTGMMEKFPSKGCLYCGHMPCDCTEKRPDPTTYSLDEHQREWSVSRWQKHMQNVYGHFNVGNFAKVYQRLMSEFGEFGILNVGGINTPNSPRELLIECRREAADVFSWLLTLAYVENINLEKVVMARYRKCPGCHLKTCNCDLVRVSPDGKTFTTVLPPIKRRKRKRPFGL